MPGFTNNQTTLNPVGPGAGSIEHKFALIFWITMAVYVLVILYAGCLWLRAGIIRWTMMPDPLPTTDEGDRTRTAVGGGAPSSSRWCCCSSMMIGSFGTSRALGSMNEENALTIDVYGHQWWWEVQYPNNEAVQNRSTTANEIHVPVGVPIRIHGTSRDVIHSFWAPNVQGKRDLMPGYDTEVMMQVDQPGAGAASAPSICGEQHAHMSFYMVAESQAGIRAVAERAGAELGCAQHAADRARPAGVSDARLRDVPHHSRHAGGLARRAGSDPSRQPHRPSPRARCPTPSATWAAGSSNAQAIKPGCRMPPNQMSGSDLQDLLAYLETLEMTTTTVGAQTALTEAERKQAAQLEYVWARAARIHRLVQGRAPHHHRQALRGHGVLLLSARRACWPA